MRRPPPTAGVALLLWLVVGVSPSAAAPSRAQFIRQGDAVCGRFARELAPLQRKAEAAKSLPEAQRWAAVTRLWTAQVRIQARFNARFHALGVPAGDSAAGSLVSGLDRALVLARRIRAAFAARDTTALTSVLPTYVRFALSLDRRITAYGFRVCGRA